MPHELSVFFQSDQWEIGTIPGCLWVLVTALFLPMFSHWFFLQFREQYLLFCLPPSLEYGSQVLTDQYHPQKCGTEEGSFWDKLLILCDPTTDCNSSIIEITISSWNCIFNRLVEGRDWVCLAQYHSSVLSTVVIQVIVEYEFWILLPNCW